jgi:hypothetical protein
LRSYAVSDFERLEQSLKELAQSKDFFPDGTPKSRVVYSFINEVVRNHRERTFPVTAEVLAKWRTAAPDSQFVLLADAALLFREAWDARGNGTASSVSPQAWELFGSKLGQAEQKLLGVATWVQDTPVWSESMLTVTWTEQGVQTDWRQVFAAAVKRWPRDVRLYTFATRRLMPKWGGSWDLLESYVDASAANVEAIEGRSYYARLYSDIGDEIVNDPQAIQWPKLKKAFHDLLQRSPTAYFKNRYASFACFARDKAAFRDALKYMPKDERYDKPWLVGHSYEACKLWASR